MEGFVVEIPASVVFMLGPIPITNTIIAAWLAMAVLIVVSVLATRKMELVPRGLQNVAEFAVESLLSICEQVAGPRGREFLPLVGTLFLFILIANWMGILPFWAESNWIHHGVHWTHDHGPPLRSANSDLNIPLAMAAIVAVWVQWLRIRSSGFLGWLKHLTIGPPPLLELISEISRPVSLALRLFGNIFAGGVLVYVMTELTKLVVPIIFMSFELFVGIVQALIFASLTLAFMSLAAAEHGAEHSSSEEHPRASH
ncbi:MAG: F0F1 ATP synthase subunit A [Chloroflexi bacterium]|nr:F0F1 ATP synthase subunit A [Chloroflexota bacterium]